MSSRFFVDPSADFQDRLDGIVKVSTYAPNHQLSLNVIAAGDGWVDVAGRTSGPVLDSNGTGKTITLIGGKDRRFLVGCMDWLIHQFVEDLWVDRALHEVYEWHRVNGIPFTDPHPERTGQIPESS